MEWITYMYDFTSLALSVKLPILFDSSYNLNRGVAALSLKSTCFRKGVESWNGSFGQGAVVKF